MGAKPEWASTRLPGCGPAVEVVAPGTLGPLPLEEGLGFLWTASSITCDHHSEVPWVAGSSNNQGPLLWKVFSRGRIRDVGLVKSGKDT